AAVIDNKVIAQAGFALNGQIVGGDAIAIDDRVANGDAVTVDHGAAHRNAVAYGQIISQVESQISAGARDGDVAIVIAEVHRTARLDVLGGSTIGTDVPARVGNIRDLFQLRHIHRIGVFCANGQIGDLLATHIDAVAVDHRTTVIDGDAVQIRQVLRHDQVQLVAVAINTQVRACRGFALGQFAGDRQWRVIPQRLGNGAAGVAGKAQAVILRSDFTALVNDITRVVHYKVVTQAGFTLNGQVVGGDAIAIDDRVAYGDAVAVDHGVAHRNAVTHGQIIGQIEGQIGAGARDGDVAIVIAE